MKKILLFLSILLLITGCNNKIEKFNLDMNYYDSKNIASISADDINIFKENNSSYILYIYNSYCSLPVPCEDIFKEFVDEYSISFNKIAFGDFKNTYLYETVKYAPSIIIIKEAKIISYLDANSKEDLDKYQDIYIFKEWINKYINLSK